jgi:hypothetical protein
MPVYMVFEPPRGDPTERAERMAFVRDGFSWPAFLFGPLWMLWHRLWLVLVFYLVVVAGVAAGLRVAGVGTGGRALIAFLIALLIGLEAGSLRRWTLLRRRWHERGSVVGDDLAAAERRFFDTWVQQRAASDARAQGNLPASGPVRASQPDVVGLFPEPGAGR